MTGSAPVDVPGGMAGRRSILIASIAELDPWRGRALPMRLIRGQEIVAVANVPLRTLSADSNKPPPDRQTTPVTTDGRGVPTIDGMA
jgi:hypothetical protein